MIFSHSIDPWRRLRGHSLDTRFEQLISGSPNVFFQANAVTIILGYRYLVWWRGPKACAGGSMKMG